MAMRALSASLLFETWYDEDNNGARVSSLSRKWFPSTFHVVGKAMSRTMLTSKTSMKNANQEKRNTVDLE